MSFIMMSKYNNLKRLGILDVNWCEKGRGGIWDKKELFK